MRQTLAFDRSSTRHTDVDGRLHIGCSNISKATVNPYRGNEIPDWEDLGLDAGRVYYLLRHPDELEQGAATFNNLPVLSRHVPVTAAAHMPELVIGSTGTDAAFDGEYLQNSAVVWVEDEIALIQADKKKEWSCAYRYVADMTPGTYKGLRYDGIMRNIVGNHVALVRDGRAGADVVVGDSKMEMPLMLKSRTALMLHGAICAHVMPLLAQDAKVDFTPALANVTHKNLDSKKLATAITKLTAGKLAQDAELGDVIELIDAVKGVTDGEVDADMIETAAETADPGAAEEDTPAVDADGDILSRVLALLEGKVSDEVLSEVAALGAPAEGAEDGCDDANSPDDAQNPKKLKGAMDSAVRIATRNMQAIRQAERDVEPVIGKVSVAMDSATGIYKLALDHMQVDTKGVHASAFPALFRTAAAVRASAARPTLAHDANLTDAEARFRKANPTAVTLIRS